MNRARFATSLAVSAALAGCSATTVTAPGTIRIGMVSDLGGLGDHSYNDSAYAGLLEARDRLRVAVAVLQTRTAADYQPSLMVFASQNYDEIFSIGYDQTLDLREVAERFPKRHFAIIDAVVDAPNVTSVTFKSAEGSFLAGALAALVCTNHTIGFLGGVDIALIREFEVGYVAGAREVDPSIRVLVKYIGDFADVATGNELAALLFDQGAGVLYTAAGKAGLGAIQEVRQRHGVFAIGVDADQDALVPGKILTSVLKRIDQSVVVLAGIAARRAARPTRLALGLKEGAVGLTDFRYTRALVTAPIRARLAQLAAAVAVGRIAVPATREALAGYRSSHLTRGSE